MNKRIKVLFIAILVFNSSETSAQSHFFRQYWMHHEGMINNNSLPNERARVNDRRMSTNDWAWKRFEAQVNGLELVNVSDSTFYLERAEVYFELWGGHAGTVNKRFQINGGQQNFLPSKGTAENNCEYLYPTVSIDFHDLVVGNNAFQFICDRGTSFWGHFIVDEMAVRCYLKPNHADLLSRNLDKFTAIPVSDTKVLGDVAKFTLNFPKNYEREIVAVHYFGHYLGYDDTGSAAEDAWHGYTHKRKYTNHIGTATKPPYEVEWNTRMIPDQGKPMAIKALVELKGGIFYWTEILEGLSFPLNRPHVQLYASKDLPSPFWTRDNQLKTAHIELPADISNIESVELHTRIWDGGEGTVKDPFRINGNPYIITTRNSPNDLVYTINKIDPKDLVPGLNEIKILSETKEHGIEVCLPGPCLIVRYKK